MRGDRKVQITHSSAILSYQLKKKMFALEWLVLKLQGHSAAAAAKSLQSCPIPSDPMDCSLPGSSVHGIYQARVLEWIAIAFSAGVILLGFKFKLQYSLLQF